MHICITKTAVCVYTRDRLCRLQPIFEQFDGSTSPPGFAAVVLLDESHVTAHCYSEKGWLAIDCFTCGTCDPNIIIDQIHLALVREMPTLSQIIKSNHERFLYEDESGEV